MVDYELKKKKINSIKEKNERIYCDKCNKVYNRDDLDFGYMGIYCPFLHVIWW